MGLVSVNSSMRVPYPGGEGGDGQWVSRRGGGGGGGGGVGSGSEDWNRLYMIVPYKVSV